MKLINHLENELGLINAGWTKFPEGEPWPFQIIELTNGRYKDINSYSTLGLSNYKLQSRINSEIISMELFLMVPKNYGHSNIPSLLYYIANESINSKKAYLRGSTIDVTLLDTNFSSFYVTYPACFPEEFEFIITENNTQVILAWLIPIYWTEKNYILSEGWIKFEELIDKSQPDFFDLNRIPIL